MALFGSAQRQIRVEITGDARGLSRALGTGQSALGRFAGAVGRITAGILSAQVISRITGGIGRLIRGLISTGLEYNALEQRAKAAFTTVLGSGEAATEMMGRLREFAKASPFPRQEFIQAAQAMAGFGFEAERIIPILGHIEDAVAAVGGTATDIGEIVDVFNRIQSQGKITGEELNRLAIRGIDAAAMIADAFGVSIEEARKMISEGKVDAEAAIDALTTGIEDKFGGAAENVKNTWTGVVDRVSGAFRDLGSAIVEPFVSKEGGGAAVEWANDLADGLRRVEAWVIRNETAIADFVDRGIERLNDAIRATLDGFTTLHTQWKSDTKPMLKDLADGFLALGDGFGDADEDARVFTEGLLNLNWNLSQLTGILGAAAASFLMVAESARYSAAILTGDWDAADAAMERFKDANNRRRESMEQADETYRQFSGRMHREGQGQYRASIDLMSITGREHKSLTAITTSESEARTRKLIGDGSRYRTDLRVTDGAVRTNRGNFIDLGRSIDRIPASARTHVSAPGAVTSKNQINDVGTAVREIGTAVQSVKSSFSMTFQREVRSFRNRGGRIGGVGDRDTVPAMLTPGEFVINKQAAARIDPGVLEMLNEGHFSRFQRGGPVGTNARVRMSVTKAIEKLLALGGLGGGIVAGQVGAMMAALRGRFPGLRLISGYRPGAITATGNRSYHGMGRAVDVPPSMAVFEWIRANYGARTKELIFSPAGGRQIHNGRNHMYTGITRAMHWDHNHWAMDRGGTLQPGWNMAYNGTGRPEKLSRTDDLGPKLDKIAALLEQVLRQQREIHVHGVRDGNEAAQAVRLMTAVG